MMSGGELSGGVVDGMTGRANGWENNKIKKNHDRWMMRD
ncbi:hypothetical protein HHX47_DHR4001053 [Lentinula edodes]|nr:hypothetical protein HHX47_DHR4001053 [Lentinula edodes]